MKVRVFKVFGREVLRIESHEEASLADVISGLVAQRMQIKQNTAQCECCGEDFDPDEDDDDETDDDEVWCGTPSIGIIRTSRTSATSSRTWCPGRLQW
jgi:hypothetical protein